MTEKSSRAMAAMRLNLVRSEGKRATGTRSAVAAHFSPE